MITMAACPGSSKVIVGATIIRLGQLTSQFGSVADLIKQFHSDKSIRAVNLVSIQA